jgi:hypothetical protein
LGSKSDLVLIDTNIFVIDLRYKRDVKFNSNRVIFNHIAKKRNGFTDRSQFIGTLRHSLL